jgi:hypothetical protein
MSLSAVALLEDADHHLRIVAPGDRRDHLLADLEDEPALRHRLGRHLFDLRLSLGRLGIDECLDLPTEIERIDHQFQPFRHEGMRLVAMLLLGKRTDILDDRIGEAGDLLHLANARRAVIASLFVHFGTQRLKSEVESALPGLAPSRPPSRMMSSPDSTRPPRPRIVSRISS